MKEANCIAGISRNGQFVRLYPIPFRSLESDQKFDKYQWIRADVDRRRSDTRPESFQPVIDSIERISPPIPTTDGWRARKDIVMPLLSESLCDIQESQKQSGTSLGVFRPKEVLDFTCEEDSENWSSAELAKLSQEDLFLTNENKLLERIPYKFRYRFRCENCRANQPHHCMVIDWELMALFRRLRRESLSKQDCLTKLKDKWLNELCGPKRETLFFTGNMQAYPQSFLILGVFWPPKTDQLDLF